MSPSIGRELCQEQSTFTILRGINACVFFYFIFIFFCIQENSRWDFATTLMQCSQTGNTPSLVCVFKKCWECMSPCTKRPWPCIPAAAKSQHLTLIFVVVMHLRQPFALPWTIGNRQKKAQNTGTKTNKKHKQNSIIIPPQQETMLLAWRCHLGRCTMQTKTQTPTQTCKWAWRDRPIPKCFEHILCPFDTFLLTKSRRVDVSRNHDYPWYWTRPMC